MVVTVQRRMNTGAGRMSAHMSSNCHRLQKGEQDACGNLDQQSRHPKYHRRDLPVQEFEYVVNI